MSKLRISQMYRALPHLQPLLTRQIHGLQHSKAQTIFFHHNAVTYTVFFATKSIENFKPLQKFPALHDVTFNFTEVPTPPNLYSHSFFKSAGDLSHQSCATIIGQWDISFTKHVLSSSTYQPPHIQSLQVSLQTPLNQGILTLSYSYN